MFLHIGALLGLMGTLLLVNGTRAASLGGWR
jgi:hypothetical protein